MRVFLIGFMGSGKSRNGLYLSGRLGLPFIDLDDYIAGNEALPVSSIFAQKGEAYFRQLEKDTLTRLIDLPAFVMACGGGTPCFDDNMERMNRGGTTIFLNPGIDVLTERLIRKKANRPLLSGKTDDELAAFIRDLHARRLPFYRQAHFTVSTVEEAFQVIQRQRDGG
jgi:shikimate kinase